MDRSLSDRVALVTGSYRGTGRGIAHVLAREGARVVVHGFDADPAEAVAQEIREIGGDALAVVGDIRNDAGGAQVLDQTLSSAGRVDVLVNNYGVAEGPDWMAAESEDWIASYQKNVLSGVRLVRGLLPGMRDRGFGRMIFVGTIGSSRPGQRMPHYYASKAALVNITVSLAKEVAGSGITVNTVSPGLIATDEVKERFLAIGAKRGWGETWEQVAPHAAREFMNAPAGFVGEPEDVGQLVAFLASERARYIHGANIRIDGGAADCVN